VSATSLLFALSRIGIALQKGDQMSVHVGDTAPDFKLSNQFGEEISLAGLRGKPVVLVFYPFSFSGICTGELCELRDNIAMFNTVGVELLAISVDSKYVQAKFAEQEGYSFNILADFWPHGAVAEAYGVFLADKGFATRATFVIDSEGVVAAKMVNGPGEARSLAEYKKALELVL
jgi:peroxiredoxin